MNDKHITTGKKAIKTYMRISKVYSLSGTMKRKEFLWCSAIHATGSLITDYIFFTWGETSSFMSELLRLSVFSIGSYFNVGFCSCVYKRLKDTGFSPLWFKTAVITGCSCFSLPLLDTFLSKESTTVLFDILSTTSVVLLVVCILFCLKKDRETDATEN